MSRTLTFTDLLNLPVTYLCHVVFQTPIIRIVRIFEETHFMQKHALTALAALLMAAPIGVRAATFSDDNWTGMGGQPGVEGPVYATVTDGSGNLYVGGSFTM